jgi:predicted nucleic acid-binding protein
MRLQTQKTIGTKRYAVDTNALVALVNHRDTWHAKAKVIFSKLDALNFTPIFLDCVMNESVSILGRRAEEQGRSDEFSTALSNLTGRVPKHEITWASKEIEPLYDDILYLVETSNGKLNFHDALIALYCQEFGVELIFSFDTDFDDIDWLTRIGDESDIPDEDEATEE